MALLSSFMAPLAKICLGNQETTETVIEIHPYTTHMLFLPPSLSVLHQVSGMKPGSVVAFKVNSWRSQIVTLNELTEPK